MEYGVLICKNCSKQETLAVRTSSVVNDVGLTLCVPTWMTNPHLCLYSSLVIVEHYYKMAWIPAALYDRWMELNGGDYQLGNSRTCMQLWDEVVHFNRNNKVPECGPDEFVEILAVVKGVACLSVCKCVRYKGRFHLKIIWAKIRSKSELKALDEVWKYSSEADHNKTNVSVSHIVWHGRKEKHFRDSFDKMLPVLGLGARNVTATAVAIHCLGNPSVHKMIELCESVKVCCLDGNRYVDFFKSVSVALRRSAHWPSGVKASLNEVAQCAGWELAIGRSMNVSDWADEEHKRTKVRMYLKDPTEEVGTEETNMRYCSILRNKVFELLMPCFMGCEFKIGFEEFIKNRQSWVSSGSSGGERLVIEGELVKINKHVLFETLSKETMTSWLDEEPRMEAVGSEKYEMGKARAIYGTKPIDYTISAYVLNEIEPRMNVIDGIEAGLTGIDVITGLFNRKDRAMAPGVECSMIDYADFNYQHTLEAQAVVFEAVANLFEHVNAHKDKVKAARWTAMALRNQWCRFPGSSKPVRIVQGMFSGCRGTNFLNTILNLAYFHVANDWVRENLGIRPEQLYHIHQGDDVWISNLSRLWAIVVYRIMQMTGLDFQAKKQMFDLCRAEFLRVLYSVEGCMGYLARAVATIIMKPIQSTEITGPAERAIALGSQVSIIYRRGFTQSGSMILWDAIVPFAGHVQLPKGGFSLPVGVLSLHPAQGGLGVLPPGYYSQSKDWIHPVPTYQASCKSLAKHVKSNMSSDWVDYASEVIQASFDSMALKDMVHESNVMDSLRAKDKFEGLVALEKDLRRWKSSLKLPVVEKGTHLMDAFFDTPAYAAPCEAVFREISSGVWHKRSVKIKGMIRSINLAITLSPFKNIPAATIALKGDWVSVVKACLAMCSKVSVQGDAVVAFNTLLDHVGCDVAHLLIDGQNLGLGIFDFKWHPIVLSYVSELARERAAVVLVGRGVRNASVAKCAIQYEFNNTLRVLNNFPGFEAVSRY
nr:MAG: RNA dependent RNA polymerase [Hanko totivirus 3]